MRMARTLPICLNLLLPGAGLFWRGRRLSACWYLLSFAALLLVVRQTGALWAIYVWIMAQVDFTHARPHRGSNPDSATKVVIWGTSLLMVVLYVLLFGPGWTHSGSIHHSLRLFVLVTVSLIMPALLLTWWRPHAKAHLAMIPENAGD